MARAVDIRRLAAKGLSGGEAGRLVLQQLLELERGRDGFLSDGDIGGLRACLRTPGDDADYRSMVHLYAAARLMIFEAQIASQQTVHFLRELERELDRYATSARVRHLCRNLPLLVSEKQYRAMKDRQRERLLGRLYSLAEVIEERTIELLGGYARCDEATEEACIQACGAAEQELDKLIDAGTLKPLRLGHTASLYTFMEAEAKRAGPTDLEELVELCAPEQERAETERGHAAYLARLEASLAQGDLTEGNDVSRYCGDVAAEDEERLLHHYLSGEQLYAAGLPEWRRLIDEFKLWQEGEHHAADLAVIREQELGELDEDGRYRSYWLARLDDVMDVQGREAAYAFSSGGSLAELLESMLTAACVRARVLLAYLQVIEEMGRVARVSFLASWLGLVPFEFRALLPEEEGEDFLSEVKLAAKSYNAMAKQVSRLRGEISGPRLQAFELEELQPDEAILAILRERIAVGVGGTGLGADWWREASGG